MGPFGDGGDMPQEEELTREEIKAIEKKANTLKRQARKKEFCYRAMKIVISFKGEPYSITDTREVRENGLRVVLEYYSKLPATLFESEEIKYNIWIYYKNCLVFNGKRVYEPYVGLVDEIISYSPGEEWEQKLFDLYNKLPEYEREKKKQEEQNKAKELKKSFRI